MSVVFLAGALMTTSAIVDMQPAEQSQKMIEAPTEVQEPEKEEEVTPPSGETSDFSALPLQPASRQDFIACDGYQEPNPKKGLKPGKTQKPHYAWGAASFRSPIFKEEGIAACNSALADPVLIPEFWRRKASLLESRALHEMSSGKNDVAIKTLGEATNFYASHMSDSELSSLKIRYDLLKAAALYRSGRGEEAEEVLASINARRPYSASIRRLTLNVRAMVESDYDKWRSLLEEEAKINPRIFHLLMLLAFDNDDYENAEFYAQQIRVDQPREIVGWELVGYNKYNKYRNIEEYADLYGARAYALNAMGRTAEALQVVQNARAEIATAIAPLPPLENGRKHSGNDLKIYDIRVSAGESASKRLDAWVHNMELRSRVDDLTLEELLKGMKTSPDPKSIVRLSTFDIFKRMKSDDPKKMEALKKLVEMAQESREKAFKEVLGMSLPEFFKERLDIEWDSASLTREGSGIRLLGIDLLRYGPEKHKITNLEDPDLFHIRLGDEITPTPLIEEGILLLAANHTEKLGKNAFVIENSFNIKRTVRYNYGNSSKGVTYQMVIRPINIDEAEDSKYRWRVIKVSDVQNALAEKFSKES